MTKSYIVICDVRNRFECGGEFIYCRKKGIDNGSKYGISLHETTTFLSLSPKIDNRAYGFVS